MSFPILFEYKDEGNRITKTISPLKKLIIFSLNNIQILGRLEFFNYSVSSHFLISLCKYLYKQNKKRK